MRRLGDWMKAYLLPFLDEFPPALCRLLARRARGRVLMSTREIAHVSGLSPSTVDSISRLTTWRTVGLERVHRFSLACGVNLMDRNNRKRHREFWTRRRAKYLALASKSQKQMAVQLMDLLRGRAERGRVARPGATSFVSC